MTTTTDMTKTVTMTTTQETRDTAPLTGIEFFSGVGGYSLAINQKLLRIEIMKAFDINTNANKVFSLNHVKEPKVTGIDRLNEIETRADVWLMSPPCQPFTSGGSRKDDKDPRSEGLLNLIKLLPVTLPKVVFLENVYNFEISNSRKLLVSSLIR